MASLVSSAVEGVVGIVSGVCTLVSVPVYAGISTVCIATKFGVKATETALLPVTYPIGKAVDCYNEKSKKEKKEESFELDDKALVNVRV